MPLDNNLHNHLGLIINSHGQIIKETPLEVAEAVVKVEEILTDEEAVDVALIINKVANLPNSQLATGVVTPPTGLIIVTCHPTARIVKSLAMCSEIVIVVWTITIRHFLMTTLGNLLDYASMTLHKL
jgi:flavorubredoxin